MISEGLGPGNGDDACRADCDTGGLAPPDKVCRCWGRPAVFACVFVVLLGSLGGGIDGA